MKDDAKILFNLKCYLESLLASGQDKIYYNDLLYDEKTIDCINAIEDLLKERKKYTILLTDKEYRKVIENAQKNITEQKDKRIQELEEENKHLSNVSDYETISLECVHLEEQLEIANSRIQELEKEKVELKEYNKIVSDRIVEYKKNSIPKQVVIEALNTHKFAYEELNKKYDNTYYEDDEIRTRDFYMIVTEDRIVQVLKKLLEGEK